MKFFTDFIRLPRYLFARKYLLIPLILFFAWLWLSLLTDLIINRPSNLKIVKGHLWHSGVTATKGKSVSYTLFIEMYEQTTWYRMSVKAREAEHIEQLLHQDDAIEMLVPKFKVKGLVAGHTNVVYQLKVNNRILKSVNEIRSSNFWSFMICTLALVFFTYLRYRYVENKTEEEKYYGADAGLR